MENTPEYSRYTWEQLQDALAHISKEKYPDNFNALNAEVARRRIQPQALPPELASTSSPFETRTSPAIPAQGGCAPAFLGWLCGSVIGIIAAYISYMSTIAHMKAVGNMAYQRDDVGFALVGMVMFYGLVGGIVGMILGLILWKRLAYRK